VRVRSPQLEQLRSLLTSNGLTVREDVPEPMLCW